MRVVFKLLDYDNSGTVTYTEFIDQLYKMKSQDQKTALIFIQGLIKQAQDVSLTHITDSLKEAELNIINHFNTRSPGLPERNLSLEDEKSMLMIDANANPGHGVPSAGEVVSPLPSPSNTRANGALRKKKSALAASAPVDAGSALAAGLLDDATCAELRSSMASLFDDVRALTNKVLARTEEQAQAQVDGFGRLTELLELAAKEKARGPPDLHWKAFHDLDDPWAATHWVARRKVATEISFRDHRLDSGAPEGLANGKSPRVAFDVTAKPV
jgi:hypothetical protein